MDVDAFIECALEDAVSWSEQDDGPPRLFEAIRHSVFPGGARVRPKLCVAVELACRGGAPDPGAVASGGVAAAVELLHCASLVHDDLPCFDDADTRRGKPSVHRIHGEPLAVLAGDALIVAAFEAMNDAYARRPERAALAGPLFSIVIGAVGAPGGIIAGQAWESERAINLRAYHRAKTAALFVAATTAGATCAGEDPAPWRALGVRLGEAYQIADDIRDVRADVDTVGKTTGRDAAHGRPNAVDALGLEGACEQLNALIGDAVDAVPPCRGGDALRALVSAQAQRLSAAAAIRPVS
ncbi:MAG: polyprenyl synthetase family protein [Pseudomonadota bacterium]